ncbi:MAG: hypothetical protein KatS3mg131_3459 [Candidatus Tectimicrobiota bacterium]|nr:MAG: hypothetical protein KatS3mg131_3459 [Candidatus Tectomicrobia bacterium]
MTIDWVRVVAVFQVLGGLHGLGQLWRDGAPEAAAGLVVQGLFAALCLLSIAAGVLLWRKTRRGFVWSMWLQLLQALRFTFGPLNYGLQLLFGLGIYVKFFKNGSGIGLDVNVLSSFLELYTRVVYKFNMYLPFEMVVNVTALLAFFYLYYVYDALFPLQEPVGVSAPPRPRR